MAISDAFHAVTLCRRLQLYLLFTRVRTLNCPKFKSPLSMVIFYCGYHSEVHSNLYFIVMTHYHLSNIERFHYLLSAVIGNASVVIRSIPLSDPNYLVAWTALEERFYNPRLIINAHLDKIFNFQPLKSTSLNDLKSFLDTFKENISALKTFDIPNKEGFIMFYIAFRLLDSSTKC